MKILFFMMLFPLWTHAESLFDRRLGDGRYVYDVLIQQGIPEVPLNLIFRMFDYNEGRIPNTTYSVLVDFSLPSSEKRLYLLNLRTANVQRFHVAHGIRTGILQARVFSNLFDSWRSSLGFFYAKGTYNSAKNGLSMYLDGIDRSNSNARDRNIVFHGANYASEEFVAKNGRLGWSEGCFVVGLPYIKTLSKILSDGSILFSYHKDLLAYSRKYPSEQALPGKEIVPPGVNRNRTPGEGGAVNLYFDTER